MADEIITHSSEETTAWGRAFAKRLTAPVLVLLTGDLGSGKTTLTKGLVAGLGAANEDEVTSPTFTLVHVYGKAAKVYHADLYRIENFHDFETLGLEDVFAKPAVVILGMVGAVSVAVAVAADRHPPRTSWRRLAPHLRQLTSLPI